MSKDGYIIKADEIAAMTGLQKKHPHNPNGQRENKSLGDRTGLTEIGVHIILVEPGKDTTAMHFHHFEDECVYVLEGEATAHIGEDTYPIGPGDFIGYRKGGLPHKISNTGQSVLKCLVAGQRAPHDMCDYPETNKRLFLHQGRPAQLVDMDDIEETVVGQKK